MNQIGKRRRKRGEEKGVKERTEKDITQTMTRTIIVENTDSYEMD